MFFPEATDLRVKRALCLLIGLGAFLSFIVLLRYIQTEIAQNVPIYDEWLVSLYIASRVKAGSLTMGDFFIRYGVQRFFFPNLILAFMIWLTDWNALATIYILPAMAAIQYGLLIYLVANTRKALTYKIVFPFALLVFSLNQIDMWKVNTNTGWYFVWIFFLLALIILSRTEPGWKVFGVAMMLTIAATFSIGSGLALLGTIPLVLWASGYRRWQYYVIWALVGGATMALHLSNLVFPVLESHNVLFPDWSPGAVRLGNPATLLATFGIYLGSPISPFGTAISVALGMAAMVLLGLNLIYLLRVQMISLKEASIWLALAIYAAAGGVLIVAGRTGSLGIKVAFIPRYISVANGLWFALLVTAAVIHPQKGQNSTRWRKTLSYANYAVSGSMMLLLLISELTLVHLFGLLNSGRSERLAAAEECVSNYPLTREDACFDVEFVEPYTPESHIQPEFIYQLADYRLTVFANQPTMSILPADYQRGEPIVIQTSSRWLNLYIREWLLQGAQEADLFHIAPPEVWTSTDTFPRPLQHVVSDLLGKGCDDLAGFLQGHSRAWYITVPEVEQEPILTLAHSLDYTVVPVHIDAALPVSEGFLLYELHLDEEK